MYTTAGFKLNILHEMLNNSGVTVEETPIRAGGFPAAVAVDRLEELRPGQAVRVEGAALANGTLALAVNGSAGLPTGGAPCFFNEECGHGTCE